MGIKFDKDPLPVEQNKYSTKIVNAYIVYDLDNWPNNLLRNFTLKNCLFGVTSIIKNSDKEKLVSCGYKAVFNRKETRRFGNKLARNVGKFLY